MGDSSTYGGYYGTQLTLKTEQLRQLRIEEDAMIACLREAIDEIGPKEVCWDLGIDESTLSNWTSGARHPETGRLLRPPPAFLTRHIKKHQRSQRFANFEAHECGFMPPVRRCPSSIEDQNTLLVAALRLFGPDGERRARDIIEGFVVVPKGGTR
jgi:hypothetical protein